MNPLDQRNHYIKEFVSAFTTQYPKSDETVLTFIATFLTAAGTDQTEVIQKTFRAGYCYYFALMLHDAFPDGEICWAAPFGHIVYVKDKIPYDIEGVYEGEAEMFIPVKRLGRQSMIFGILKVFRTTSPTRKLHRLCWNGRRDASIVSLFFQ